MNYTALTTTQLNEAEAALRGAVGSGHIFTHEPMSRHTSFRTGGEAAVFLTPDETELARALSVLSEIDIRPLVVGNGSNLLISDDGIDGVVIKLGEEMAQITVDAEGARITAGAGARLGAAARKAAEAGLAGMEFASGIPGSVGGAVMMNAGAYGGEMKDIVTAVRYIPLAGESEQEKPGTDGAAGISAYRPDPAAADRAESAGYNGGAQQMPGTVIPDDNTFAYRHSIFMETAAVITSVELQLQKGDPEAIRARMQGLNERRIAKQPLEYPSAGSTFKRPEGYFAGKLIEDAGLRGYRVGGAAVSEKHCGFVVNDGNATSADIYRVISHVQKEVKRQFGVDLEPEVRLVGRFNG